MALRNVCKGAERLALDLLSSARTREGRFCCAAIVALQIVVAVLGAAWVYRDAVLNRGMQAATPSCDRAHAADNIAAKLFPELGCQPPIDVVFTWVNGSDPVWLAKLAAFKAKLEPDPPSPRAPGDDTSEARSYVSEAGPSKNAPGALAPGRVHTELNDTALAQLKELREELAKLDQEIKRLRETGENEWLEDMGDALDDGLSRGAELSDGTRVDGKLQVEGHSGVTGRVHNSKVTKPTTLRGGSASNAKGSDKPGSSGGNDEEDDVARVRVLQGTPSSTDQVRRQTLGLPQPGGGGYPEGEEDEDEGEVSEGRGQASSGGGGAEEEDPYAYLEDDQVLDGSGSQAPTSDQRASANRFRDNNELRYSLRSIEKFAPWVRNIFIVTDNQIPSFLDLNHPRLRIVPHTEIFKNHSHLPTFSSPAIESNLHRIKGLSQRFLYFNDDVMLGAPVWPEDFYSPITGQLIYQAWGLPQCSPGCVSSWLGDGFCDTVCDTEACEFDHGDCNKTASGKSRLANDLSNVLDADMEFDGVAPIFPSCRSTCVARYLADNFCDRECDCVECGFDAGDCLGSTERSSRAESPYVWWDDIDASKRTGVAQLPFGTRALGINMRPVLARLRANLTAARYEDSGVVLAASFNQKTGVFSMVFGNPNDLRKEHLQWGGPGLADYAYPGHVDWLCAEDKFLAGCPGDTGCESFADLAVAKALCAIRGPACGGITGSNRFEKEVRYQLRKPGALASSATYETTCVKVTSPPDSLDHTKVGDVDGQREETTPRYSGNDGEGDESADEASNEYDEPRAAPTQIVSLTFKLSNGDSLTVQLTAALSDDNKSSSLSRPPQGAEDAKRVLEESASFARTVQINAAPLEHRMKSLKDKFSRVLQRFEEATLKHSVEQNLAEHTDASDMTWWSKPKSFVAGVTRRNKTSVMDELEAVEHANNSSLPQQPEDRRGLGDPFAESLLHVNSLFNQEFGSRDRKVIAHMPHLINVPQLARLQARWPQEFERTSSNRFRTSDDMQFAFSYMWWVVHEGDEPALTVEEFFAEILDTNQDGLLDVNELRTLAAIVAGPEAETSLVISTLIDQVQCLRGLSESVRVIEHAELLRFTVEQVKQCKLTKDAIVRHSPRKKTSKLVSESDVPVSFQMIGDDLEEATKQLDSIRARQHKFICINDNMEAPSDELLAVLHEFFEAMFPVPSQFELPQTRRNRYLYLDELEAHVSFYAFYSNMVYGAFALLLALVGCSWSSEASITQRCLPERSEDQATAVPEPVHED